MEREMIADKLKNIIVEVKNQEVSGDSIADSTNLVTDVGIDSLQLINFILSIEDEFEIELDFDSFDLDHLNRFGSLVEFVEGCISKKTGTSQATDDLLLKLTGI
ncbi:MAG: hypothetical protein JW915_01185 [Chitinispirillaceae bacterium]|nr:hypothetical protein [Chitinispirillaceae bacterium]